MDLDCLTGLVGLSNLDCQCIEADRPANYNESRSGYYLTDLEHGVPLKAAVFAISDCFGGRNIWQVLQEAIRLAILDFQTELLAAIYNGKENNFAAFSGVIGQQKANTILAGRKRFAGIVIEPKSIKGGSLVIRDISLGLNCNTEVSVFLVDSEGNELLNITIPTQEGSFVTFELTKKIEIPLYSMDCQKKYYLYYEMPQGCAALQNKFQCCGRTPDWKKYLSVGGFNSDTLNISSTGNIAYGLSMGAFLQCKGLDWLCNIDALGEYKAMSVVAKTIQFKAASKLISMIVGSNNINFYTLSNRESLFGKMRHFNKRYIENIQWISENIPENATDCFTCKQSERLIRKASLV